MIGPVSEVAGVSLARALVLESPRRLVARDLPLPEIGDDDGLLAGRGVRPVRHRPRGVHRRAVSGLRVRPGSRVGRHRRTRSVDAPRPVGACRTAIASRSRCSCRAATCDACRSGAYQRCERHGLADMYGFVDVDRAPGLWGGYAEHQYLAPDSMLRPVPDDARPGRRRRCSTRSAPASAGRVTVPGTRAGDVVAVLGPGVRGLSACAAAKHAGAGFVMVTGRGERDAPRLAVAPRVRRRSRRRRRRRSIRCARCATRPGGLADVVVDVTAKAPAAFAQAIKLARPGGTVVVAGTRGGSGAGADFDPDQIVYKELRVLGALGVDTAAYDRGARAARRRAGSRSRRCRAASPGFDDVGDAALGDGRRGRRPARARGGRARRGEARS